MAKYAMGWLGWTEQEALSADVNSIEIAMEGRVEMMYPKARAKPSKATVADKWKAIAKRHNAVFRARGGIPDEPNR